MTFTVISRFFDGFKGAKWEGISSVLRGVWECEKQM